jgi:hypothetical protein
MLAIFVNFEAKRGRNGSKKNCFYKLVLESNINGLKQTKLLNHCTLLCILKQSYNTRWPFVKS